MKRLLLTVTLLASLPAWSAEFRCPGVLPSISKGKAGAWIASIDRLRAIRAGVTPAFEAAEVRDGTPAELGTLIPDNDEQEGKYWEWGLYWGNDTSYQLFAACSYKGTNVVLIQPLPRNLAKCRVSRKGAGVQTVSCQ